MRHRELVALLVALLAMAPGAASAQPAAALEQARKAFARGEEAESGGDCATAIERYQAVVAIKETPAVRLRIGRCQERLGQLRAALETYARAKELAQGEPQALEVATQVEAALAARIPRVVIQVTDGSSDVVVTLDGVAVTPGDGPFPVDPGAHTVTARAPGKRPFDLSFELAEGDARAIDLVLQPIGEATTEPSPVVTEDGGSSFPWGPGALYAATGVALAIGVPLLITSAVDDAALDAQCFDQAGRPSEDRDPCFKSDGSAFSAPERATFEDDRSSVNTRQGVGWVLIGVGTITAGIATVLLITDAGGATNEPEAEVDTAGLRVRSVVPRAGPGEAGLRVGGTF